MSRLTWLAPVLLLAGCELALDGEPPDPPGPPLATYELVPRGNMALLGDGPLAWDGSAFWIVERDDDGQYWTPDRMEIRRFDPATGTSSPPIVLTDHWERATGGAWLDGHLWVHYDASNAGLVTSIDPATGVETRRFNVGVGFGDIDTDGALLYFGQRDTSAVVEVRDTAGTIVAVRWSEGFQASLRGIALVTPPGATAPELWGSTLASNQLTIMVGDQTIATASVPGFANNDLGMLMFAGQTLIVGARNQLFFFDVVRPPGA